MVKPKFPSSIPKNYVIPEAIRQELEFEPYILNSSIVKLCDPLEYISAIPVKTLSELDIKNLYNNLIQGLYLLATRHENDTDLNKDTKKYLKGAYTYCSKKAFQKKLILKANTALKENEEYLNNIKIKEAKKRTAQEAELLDVDMTHSSIKQYRSELLIDVSNARQSEQAESHSPHQTGISSSQYELNKPSVVKRAYLLESLI